MKAPLDCLSLMIGVYIVKVERKQKTHEKHIYIQVP